jgi:hypothetical protein
MALIRDQKERAMPLDDAKHRAAEVLELREALKMLFDLLEEHAASWYTEEHHDKAEAALRFVKNDVTSTSRACRVRPQRGEVP